MRLYFLALTLVAGAAATAQQQQPRVTADDYARAERMLGQNVAPLITGAGVRPIWLADGRFWYHTQAPNGAAVFVIDPAKRTRAALLDAPRLAAALAAASGGRVDASRLPAFELSKDNRSITVMMRNRRYSCDLQQYSCAPADSSSGSIMAPENSSVSPD